MRDTTTSPSAAPALLGTGVEGLDEVLGGGFTEHRLYLIEGTPGTGKTTLALQFLMAGARLGESVLYVTLSETTDELLGVANSHGWSLANIHVREVLPTQESLQPEEQYTMFHPSEVELGETTLKVLKDVEMLQPTRVVLDSLSEMRLLAGGSLRFRRQILALKQFLAGRRCTVLLLDDMTTTEHDLQVQSISHAVVRLEQNISDFGAARRRLLVLKYRGQDFRGGYHDYKIVRGGMKVFPRLVASEHVGRREAQPRIESGIPTFDTMLGGGIERGTSTLIIGAPGTGKSSLALQFAVTAAARGERSALFLFDESQNTLVSRADGTGMKLQQLLDSGSIEVHMVDPGALSPGELVQSICESVTRNGVSIVVIDSLNGYLNAMPDERFLIVPLHEVLSFLGHAGVATLLVAAQQGLIGPNMANPVDASYLADTVVLMRYYEAEGEVRQAISVLKKRGGPHERSIRAFSMNGSGLQVGEPLRHYRGVLTGVPTPLGAT